METDMAKLSFWCESKRMVNVSNERTRFFSRDEKQKKKKKTHWRKSSLTYNANKEFMVTVF